MSDANPRLFNSYASGVEATTVVWVAPSFRDEHRRALVRLNERTDIGVEFSVVQIGEVGPRRPVFDVIARPNDWQKAIKQIAGQALRKEASQVNEMRQEFFAEVLAEVFALRPAVHLPSRDSSNWLAFASAPWGNWDIAIAQVGRLRVQARLDTGDAAINKAHLR